MQQMPAGLFREWQAFFLLEPFGSERAELHAASIVTAIAESNRDRKKRRKAFELQDFAMPAGAGLDHAARPRKEQSWQEMLQVVEQINAAMGGRDLRKKEETQ